MTAFNNCKIGKEQMQTGHQPYNCNRISLGLVLGLLPSSKCIPRRPPVHDTDNIGWSRDEESILSVCDYDIVPTNGLIVFISRFSYSLASHMEARSKRTTNCVCSLMLRQETTMNVRKKRKINWTNRQHSETRRQSF